ncbi:uncharacterized protein LOC110415249 [Herrania umbratica]|uniref:Uncharacterized protein LOC110415249 n=1 Tax=Herrania umbratica TaxID=108875 RepID=A0A6J1A723_9ROSI|nr:uncharacterized protein LOC110415249 [Herrania umbratica]
MEHTLETISSKPVEYFTQKMKKLSLSILFLACLVAFAAAQSASDVTAYWTDYKPTDNGWELPSFCAGVDGDKPLEWRKKFGWTGFCGPSGSQGVDSCGKCLNVTNTATGAFETVRIVDTCGTGGLELDLETAFKPIDTDGNGIRQGHLTVDYAFVDCDADDNVPDATDVTAYWTDYKPSQNSWEIPSFCAAVDGSKPLEWRSKYGWTGFCGPVGPTGVDACGKCLKVTNTETKDEEIVRIVDTCGTGGLELDLETAFKPIDSNGNGIRQGHLIVDYKIVDCDDDAVLVYSQ